jgi:hypothetical protein
MYLVTGGRYVITYGFSELDVPLERGTYTAEFEANLTRGTPAGEYALRVLPGSELLFVSGELASPAVTGDVAVSLSDEVTAKGADFDLLAELLVRIADAPASPRPRIRAARVQFEDRGFVMEGESGGFSQEGPPRFSPAEVRAGTVSIRGFNVPFVRGDVNADGGINIADPLYLLSRLFGSVPPCPSEEACDLNDDGGINVTDAVFGLNRLFGAGLEIPPPSFCGDAALTPNLFSCVSFPSCP